MYWIIDNHPWFDLSLVVNVRPRSEPHGLEVIGAEIYTKATKVRGLFRFWCRKVAVQLDGDGMHVLYLYAYLVSTLDFSITSNMSCTTSE